MEKRVDRPTIDKDWFFKKLAERGKSVRGLGRHMGLDGSSVSRMLGGTRRMQMDEASVIAGFLGVDVEEILSRAGLSLGPGHLQTRITLVATIDDRGNMHPIEGADTLPQPSLRRAQAAIKPHHSRSGEIFAAQIRAETGALSVWDDAVILYRDPKAVDHEAMNAPAVCWTAEGNQFIARIDRSRKTGEARVMCASGELVEVDLTAAAPILAIIP